MIFLLKGNINHIFRLISFFLKSFILNKKENILLKKEFEKKKVKEFLFSMIATDKRPLIAINKRFHFFPHLQFFFQSWDQFHQTFSMVAKEPVD
jgi:hypothetical protein